MDDNDKPITRGELKTALTDLAEVLRAHKKYHAYDAEDTNWRKYDDQLELVESLADAFGFKV